MATTKSTSKRSASTNGSKPKAASSGRSAAAKTKSSSSKRTSSNGNKPKSASASKSSNGSKPKTKTASRSKAKSRTSAQSRSGADSFAGTAVEKTKAAGHTVAEAASKAKTPLIAGGTAIVGAAAGVLIKDRLGVKRSKNPLKRLGGVSMPKPTGGLDLGKVDLKTVKSTAERVSAYGQQASDLAAAVEKTRKKNK